MSADLSTQTPAEIDTELARIYSVYGSLSDQRIRAEQTIERIDSVQGTYEADFRWNSPEKRAEAASLVEQITVKQRALRAEAAPLEERYEDEGWTRYYLVTNASGHVHSSTACDTCFPTTQFAWLTEQSGLSAEALVDLAGEKACTVCFPWAPVDVLKQRTRLEAPERKAAREEREAKAAAKRASEITVEGYLGYNGRSQAKVFKTERAVTNDIAGNLSSLAWYGLGHPSAAEWLSNVEACRKALADKGVEYDYDKALAAARKKVAKEGGFGYPKY